MAPMKADLCVNSTDKIQIADKFTPKEEKDCFNKNTSHKTHGATGQAKVKFPNFDKKNL